MAKIQGAGIAILIGVVAAAVPILVSLQLANQQSVTDQEQRARATAGEILRRSNQSTQQIIAALEQLNRSRSGEPCSSVSLGLMQSLDLSSSYLQALGHIRNDQLECSSLGLQGLPVPVGRPDYVSANGYATRLKVELPPGSGNTSILSEKNGFVAIVHPDLAIDLFVDEPGVAVGTVAISSGAVLLARGVYKPGWLAALGSKDEVVFFDGDETVALVRSKVGDFAAYAAIPAVQLRERMLHFALRLVPVGLLVGVLLAWLLRFLVKQQSSMRTQLRAGLKRDEFSLVFQPIVALQTGRWIGAEALIRWRRSSGEMVRPDLFIPVAEESGFIQAITEHVMLLAAPTLRIVSERNPEFHLAINVSAQDLESALMMPALQKLVRDSGANATSVVIEITERGIMHTELARAKLAEVRSAGARVAIDDFGTGYSSLSYLASFELDYLKIDKSFIDSIGTEAPTSQVVPHIIAMAKSLKLEMIAEGVETGEQAKFLREQGVQYAQGYLFARPMPATEFIERLAERS